MNKSWLKYYLPKVNNKESEQKFFDKYYILFNLINNIKKKYNINTIIEEGCGTGVISKLLVEKNDGAYSTKFTFVDSDEDMLQLTRINTSNIADKDKEMLKFNIIAIPYHIYNHIKYDRSLLITHGVLEHFFDDYIIERIIKRYDTDNNIKAHIHYVPIDGYTEKSFGDERLLSVEHWINLVKPTSTIIVDNKDLFMVKIK